MQLTGSNEEQQKTWQGAHIQELNAVQNNYTRHELHYKYSEHVRSVENIYTQYYAVTHIIATDISHISSLVI